jgi:ferredoxin
VPGINEQNEFQKASAAGSKPSAEASFVAPEGAKEAAELQAAEGFCNSKSEVRATNGSEADNEAGATNSGKAGNEPDTIGGSKAISEFDTQGSAEAANGEAGAETASANAEGNADDSETNAEAGADANADVAVEAEPDATADAATEPDDNASVDPDPDPFPRERIVALPSWCTAPLGTGCQRCAVACPTGAITFNEKHEPQINEEQCTRCGLCAGVCDAFAWERFTLEDLFERACQESEEEGSACFTCNDHLFTGVVPRSNVFVLPCLAAVPPEFWCALLAAGVNTEVYLDNQYCEGCPTAGNLGPALWAHALETGEDWAGGTINRVKELPERELLLTAMSHADQQDRRGMISTLVQETREVADGTHRKRNAASVAEFREKQERMHATARIESEEFAHSPWAPKTRPWPRQELMVQAAQAMPGRAALVERYCSTTNCEACCASGKCIEVCPTGARSMVEEGTCPKVDAKKCNACGACIANCPSAACDFKPITAQEYC